MDFKKILENSKFLFHWDNHDLPYDLNVVDMHVESLIFKDNIALPVKDSPKVTVSIKVKHYWHEHHFDQTEWIVGNNGQVCGLRLLEPIKTLEEFRKNLEIGLCV